MLLVPAHYLFFLQQIKPVSKRELYIIVIAVQKFTSLDVVVVCHNLHLFLNNGLDVMFILMNREYTI